MAHRLAAHINMLRELVHITNGMSLHNALEAVDTIDELYGRVEELEAENWQNKTNRKLNLEMANEAIRQRDEVRAELQRLKDAYGED